MSENANQSGEGTGETTVTIPPGFAARRLRETVSLPPVAPAVKKALESTGHLPTISYEYKMSDVLALAIQGKASDLHLRVGEPPLYRMDGKLVRADGLPLSAQHAFTLIEAIAPEEIIRIVREVGQADFGFAFESHRFRVNVFRSDGDWAAVLRRIPEKIPTFEEILAPAAFIGFTRLPRGLVLVTGPTGSGKTTSLAAMIDLINSQRSDVHILTLEDPIEFKHPRKEAVVTQRELGRDFLTFADGLRAALREDPDIIMVGEMRDPETIEAALTAAETGHLVFSTLHTTSAKDTVDRIISAFPKSNQENVKSQLASILRGVVSQTLLPHSSGRGRVAAFEIMVGTPAIANLIRENNTHQIPSVLQTHSRDGMCTLDQSLADRYAAGLVKRSVALDRAQDLKELTNLIQRMDQKTRVV